MKSITYYQQGDVVLVKTNKIEGTKLKGSVIQEGEHTGHAHRFQPNTAQLFGSEGTRTHLKALKGGTTITHEEHLPVTIPAGEYEIRIVRQKDPFTKLISKVID